VVENANQIVVDINTGGTTKSYNAVLIQKDEDNDLAILKIKDDSYKPLASLQYSFKEGGVDVGASVFTIGYPYALSGMGKEAKFTDGKISSKTGYNNAINSYQTSIPVQPGNSGGPLFTDKGQFMGIMNAKFKEADNVSYAVKLNYIKNLIELLPETIELPNNTSIQNLSLEEKIKILSEYVALIKIK
jgi:S1-C subfamily serine protease